jgi:uncharacterized protein (DUF58 family)
MSRIYTLRQRWHRLGRQKHPETGVIRLDRRRVFIFPTYAGLFYMLTLMAMHLGSINYDLALGHALVFLLVSLGLTALLHTYRNLHGLEISALHNEAVHAGETAYFRLLVRNPARRPRLSLEWSGDKTRPPQTQYLPNGNDSIMNLALAAPVRGWLRLPSLKVASRYPLGIFLAWACPWPDARCLIYPQPVFTPLPPVVEAGTEGTGQGHEGHEDFIGLRERQPADSFRHVAWKAAARDGGNRPLLVKRFGGAAGWQLWLDWQATQGSVEARLSILTGWVLEAEGADLDYGLVLPGQTIPPACGALHQQHCLRALALYPHSES